MFEAPTPSNDAPVVVQRYAVFGHPVAHSRSPFIHARFAEQTKLAMSYVPIDADPDAFPSTLAAFEAGGGLGANVTLPLKMLAARRCKLLSPHAQRIGAVNTLTRLPDGGWRGDNTDGAGLVADIAERHRLDLRGRRTLVLGAGGAAHGIIPALLDAGIASLTIANRTPERADTLADEIGEPSRVHTVYWQDLREAGSFELILDATSAGHGDVPLELPFALVNQRTLAYSLNYGRAASTFLAWGQAARITHVFDGVGMLVEQAAEAFALWHGVRPETEPVYQALRRELAH
jgi:shikimate dehydrogenase